MKKEYTCKYCGNNFSRDDCGKNPTFCCLKCQQKYREERRKHYICKNCGKEFIREPKDKNKIFCCLECYKNYRTEHKVDYDKYKKEYDKQYYMKNKEEIKEYRKEYIKNHQEEYKIMNKKRGKTLGTRYGAYRAAAKRRNIDFNITKEQFKKLWNKPCYYCGSEIVGIGVDRFDNTKGYEVDNIVPCCAWCNKMKLTETKEDFINHCKKIINFNK